MENFFSRPGPINMCITVNKSFTLEDLNLSDMELFDKYNECHRNRLNYNSLTPKALRMCINHELRHERV